MQRDDFELVPTEDVVVRYIDDIWSAPEHIRPLVAEYNKIKAIVDASESYPRSLDKKMNVLFDAMVVMA